MKAIGFLFIIFIVLPTVLFGQQDDAQSKRVQASILATNIKAVISDINDPSKSKDSELSLLKLEDLILSLQKDNLELELNDYEKEIVKGASLLLYKEWVVKENNLPEYNETVLKRELSKYLNKFSTIDLDKLIETFNIKLSTKLYYREGKITAEELNIMSEILPYYIYKINMKDGFVWDNNITSILFLENGLLANIKTFAFTKRLEFILSYLKHLDKIVQLGFLNTANGNISRSFDLLKIKKAEVELHSGLFVK
ncbi:MAG: hypothetical protein WCQ47_07260 [bacterium]